VRCRVRREGRGRENEWKREKRVQEGGAISWRECNY
jgi:hypothetical protein